MDATMKRLTIDISEKLYDQMIKSISRLEAKSGLNYSTSDYVRMALSEKLLKGGK